MELFIENPEKNIRLPLKLEENSIRSQDCDMLKIFFLETGGGVLSIDGRPAEVNAPAVVCLNGRESFKMAGRNGLRTRTLYFSPSMVNSVFNIENIAADIENLPETARLDHYYFKPFIRKGGKGAEIIRPEAPAAGRITAVFEALEMQMYNYGDNYWPCRNRSYLIELLFVMQQCLTGREAVFAGLLPKNSGIADIILYLNINYDRKITIEELSKQFHTNRNSLNRNFRSKTGRTVIGYLIKARIDAACRLLRDTSLPVSEIAERVGFSELSYWGRAFRKQTGVTPSAYRKAQHSPPDICLPGRSCC
jgi:AraC-like DNA-binding protein